MGKEIILIAEALSNERAIPRDKIFEALASALETATKKKKNSVDIEVRVKINPKDGSYRTFRQWDVVPDDELTDPATQTTLSAARLDHAGVQVGDKVEEEIESVKFDRITVQTAKQVLSQKVKDAEREQVINEQLKNVGRIVNATVKKQGIVNILDLGNNAEAILKRDQTIPNDKLRRGDRIKVLLQEIRYDYKVWQRGADGEVHASDLRSKDEYKGPQLICSRSCPEFLKELFKIEVPEIGEGIIEIMGVARDPGLRAKIAVRSKDRRIDPRGACIGMRGARVKAVSDELCGEKIDVVLWDENFAQYVTNAMEPAEVSRIIINEDTHTIDVAVAEANLALAIGSNGINVRLASKLLDWKLNVLTESKMEEGLAAESSKVTKLFMDALNVDEEFANVLADAGFTSLEEIAYVPVEEFDAIEGMDRDMAVQLQDSAKRAIEAKAKQDNEAGTADLTRLKGIDAELAAKLIASGIKSAEELAEKATDDLLDIEGLDEQKAGEIIMAARNECWFKDAK